MSKKNKWPIVPFILIAALLIVVFIYTALRRPAKPAEPIKAIPVSASLIIKVNDFRELFEKTSDDYIIWRELRNIPVFNRADRQLQFIDSLIHSVPDVEQIFDNPPFFISLHITGNEKISLLHVFQLPSKVHPKKITELINRLVVSSGTVKVRSYEGTSLYEVALLDKSVAGNFSFAIFRDILMISFSNTILEDAIRQLNGDESLLSSRGFNKMYATAGKNVNANVFINFSEFPKTLSAFVKPDFKSEVRSFKNIADWAELDLNPLSDILLMNGFVNPSDSVPSMASMLLNQSPQHITSDEILPSTVASFLTYNISDTKTYIAGFRDFLKEQGLLSKYNNTLQSLNNAYGTRFPDDFFDIMDREITLGFNGNVPAGGVPDVYFILRIKSKTQTEEKLNAILQSMARVESKPLSEFVTEYRLDAETGYKIGYLPVRKLTSKIFGSLFSVLDEHYYVVLDNYLVFSGSVESLKSLIHNYILNKTLENDPAYREFKNNISPRSNLCFYCNLSRSQAFYSAYLTQGINRMWMNNLGVFQNIQIFGLQLYANNSMLYSNFVVKHLSARNAAAQTVWESKLDTLIDFKPVFVMNHQTGQNEVFVQDLNNSVYLINHVGRILWKIRLPEQINSEVFQVDYFRNGKLQFLFSTRNEIYLIDRKGNFVEKYPVRLRSPATNGLAVFDYDRNREYRLFIACEDNKIYAYSRDGSLITGWQFDRSESEVRQPLNHFRIGDRDYIVFGDRFKTYILDRRGSTRINVDTWFPRSANNNYLLNLSADNYSPSVVTTDSTGKVYFIGFNGKVNALELPGKFSNRHYFDYKDLNGDNKPEYIFLEADRLMVFGNDQRKMFTYKFGGYVTYRPQFYQFSASDKKLGVVVPDENLIYLINNNGDLYEGFPLQGNTPFSIGNFSDTLSRFNLVVGSRDNFLYNYRVK